MANRRSLTGSLLASCFFGEKGGMILLPLLLLLWSRFFLRPKNEKVQAVSLAQIHILFLSWEIFCEIVVNCCRAV